MRSADVLLALLSAFLLGVGIGSFWTVPSTSLLWIVLFGSIVVTVSAYRRTFGITARGIRRRKIGFLVGVSLLVFSFGLYHFNTFFTRHSIVAEFADRQVIEQGVPVTMRGYVDGEFDEVRGQFVFRVTEVVTKRILETDERVLVTTDSFPPRLSGDQLELYGAPETPKNFSDFDYVTYLRTQGVRHIVRFPDIAPLSDPIPLSVSTTIRLSAYRHIFSFKQAFESAIERSVREPHAAFLNGILLGTRSKIPDSLQEAFAKTNTSHILAISGYNITVVAEAVLWILLFVFRRRRAFWVTVVAIVAFTILTGASASVVRAALMGLLLLFARSYGRLYDAKYAIVLAAAVMVYINPMVLVFDAGFQLSFLAVLGLLYIYPLLAHAGRRLPKLLGATDILFMTVSAQIAVAPLIAFLFGTVSVVGILANILVVPIIPFSMLAGFCTGIAGLVWGAAGQLVGSVAWLFASYELGIIRAAAALPLASKTVQLSAGGFALSGIVLIAVVTWLSRTYGSSRL